MESCYCTGWLHRAPEMRDNERSAQLGDGPRVRENGHEASAIRNLKNETTFAKVVQSGRRSSSRLRASIAEWAHSASADSTESDVRIGLVLSGGGLRGASHIGVLQQLVAHGIPLEIIVGSSAGAIVAAYYAAVGLTLDELVARTR
jgi:hypothetical protein